MFRIGCHLSIAAGYAAAAKTALSIGANTFQFFSRNPRGGSARKVDFADIAEFKKITAKNGISEFLAHAPYTLNAASADPSTRAFARSCMDKDLETLSNIGNAMYNFHPGSHTGQGVETGIAHITALLNEIMNRHTDTEVLLELMSGKGSEIGANFAELKTIIDAVDAPHKPKVLIDTCHIYSAGYDIVNNLDGVLEEFDKTIGLKNLRAIHLNDSMTPFNSHKDRHAVIGGGSIGLEAFARIINHPALKNLPFYLETPLEPEGYAEEIKLLKSIYNS